MRISGSIKGDREMIQKLREIARQNPERVAKAAFAEMEIETTEMKKRTPVDTTPDAPHPGNLRNSIHVEEPEIHGRQISVTVATGSEAPYAIYVHENPDAIHPVGEWKFMESVLNESRSTMGNRMAKRIGWKK